VNLDLEQRRTQEVLDRATRVIGEGRSNGGRLLGAEPGALGKVPVDDPWNESDRGLLSGRRHEEQQRCQDEGSAHLMFTLVAWT
jgi:hypothetical protein